MSEATQGTLWGIVAEFPTPDALREACVRVREAGYRRFDAHTPFPVHGLDAAMGIRPTRLPWLVLGAGLTGCVGGIVMQWWMNAVDYALPISGKPMWSLPANIPVAFEMTILFAAMTTFFGMLVANALPELHHPLFGHDRFRRATNDGFFVSIEASDPRFDPERTEAFLREIGGSRISAIRE